MSWSGWYRLASYVRSSLWVVPIFAIIVELIVVRLTDRLDARLGWTLLGLHVGGAQVLYQTVITLTISFMVFTFGSLLVAIQVASGQLTPRVIATTLLRDRAVKYTVGLFVFTLLFAVRSLDRMGDSVHQFNLFTTAMLGLICLGAFLFLIDYAARLLRPASIVWHVGETGLEVLRAVYTQTLGSFPTEPVMRHQFGEADAVVLHTGNSGSVLAVNVKRLFAEAQRTGTTIEFVPHVGDFVAVDEPLFKLHGVSGEIDEQRLRSTVAVGSERTMEQDPTFAFRILVDIALKGLSKAINDPTTAVLAIDQLHRLLRNAGRRYLQLEQIMDDNGRVLVILRTPNWDDYVHLACREIRLAAGENIQIPRRLRAMLENLIMTLPQVRHAALQQELDLLDRAIQKIYVLPEDLALARIPDAQGMGGTTSYPEDIRAPYAKVADAA
jgi:uncharacterized membrane protein